MKRTALVISASLVCFGGCDSEDAATESAGHAPGNPPGLERFNLLPEGAAEGSYWVSSVEIDDLGVPHLVDAVEISEEEMLAQAAELQRMKEEGVEPKVWGQVACNAYNVSPLVMTQRKDFQGNRICIENTTWTSAWFYLGNWYWDTVQISGNIGSVGDANEFQFETWTDSTVATHPLDFPGSFNWPTTAACWTNTDDDGFGITQIPDTGLSCHRFVTWVWLGFLPAQF